MGAVDHLFGEPHGDARLLGEHRSGREGLVDEQVGAVAGVHEWVAWSGVAGEDHAAAVAVDGLAAPVGVDQVLELRHGALELGTSCSAAIGSRVSRAFTRAATGSWTFDRRIPSDNPSVRGRTAPAP